MAITVKPGTTVTWTNDDSAPHTVTGDNHQCGSQGFSQGQSYSYTFTQSGTYSYHCDYHPYMVGKIVVSAAS